MKKSRIIKFTVLCLLVASLSYSYYQSRKIKSYAFDLCETAKKIKNKDKITQFLPSKEEVKKKSGTIIFNDKEDRITMLFVSPFPFSRAICSLHFKDNELKNAFFETGYE